jgi:hypothetical protein
MTRSNRDGPQHRVRLFPALVAVACLGIGCGSSDPLSSPPPAEIRTFEFVLAVDLDAYVSNVRQTIPSLNLTRDEFQSILIGQMDGTLTAYWARQFTGNLMKRLAGLQKQVRAIRPANGELRSVHSEYEEALAAYGDAFTAFADQLGYSTSQSIEDVNAMLYSGNSLMDRFQLRLSNLAGVQVTL